MIDKIIRILAFYFLGLYADRENYETVLKELKDFTFDKRYSPYRTKDATPSEVYESLVRSANKGARKLVENSDLFRELRREKTFKYAKLKSILDRKMFD